MADLHPTAMAVFAPDTALFPWLAIINIDSCPMLAIEPLVRKIVTADPDILTETNFAGDDWRKRRGQNGTGERQRRKQSSGGKDVRECHVAILL
jgi:hypothetical protein